MKNKGSFCRFFFLCCLILYWSSTLVYAAKEDMDGIRKQAVEVFARLDQMDNFVESLSLADMNVFPVGMKRTVSNVNYALAISSIQFFQEYAELAIWGRAIIPQGEEGDKILFFGAQGIKLSNEGDIVGDARLVLLGDITIPINNGAASLVLKGGFNLLSGIGDQQTYMSIDCQGFKELGLTADLILSDKLVRKVDENGNCSALDSKVMASFSTIVQDWNDMVVSLSLPRFEIIGLNGFMFQARDAIFDFSDTRNADNISYPYGYQEQYMIPGNENLWKGVYINELSITLPRQFTSRRDTSKRVSFISHHMLFDNNGISGVFEAQNVLAFDNGTAGGWPFSVERFSIELIANHLNGAGFGGQIGLPVAEKSPLNYDAYISPDNEYMLRISKSETMKFSIWAAEAELLPNSYVEMKVKDGRFRPEAMLSGSLMIKAGMQGGEGDVTVAELKGIKFQQMHLKTESPYFMVQYLGYDGDFSVKGFPLSVGRIELKTAGLTAELGFDAKLALGASPFSIAGDTRLGIVGKMKQDRGLQSWEYDHLNISAIQVNTSFAGVFAVRGSLTLLNNDPLYGDGFAGNMDLELTCLEGVGMKARAMFGKKDFRYWLVDGSVMFGKSGITVFPPAFNLSGIGGGAYYKMAQRGMGESALPTGTVYVPDEKRGFGFKAAVMFNIGNPDVVSGEADFEIAFNDKGGLAYIGFFGQVKVLGKIPGMDNIQSAVKNKLTALVAVENNYLASHPGISSGLNKLQKYKLYQPADAALDIYSDKESLGKSGFLAAMGIQYDFNQKCLHATFDLYVNVLAGLIKGRGQNNNAGHSVLHIEKGNWYFHMGTPSNRLGIEMNLLNLIKIKSGAYFMTGSHLEGSPPPPQQVADILGVELRQLDYMRDMNALEAGGGFAFGADVSVATGDITFLILYANFQAGLGFDIMLKDYGQAECNGRRGPVGIDGWYANGQAYAYLQGEAGVSLKLLFIRKKIPIIKAGAATLFQAKLPNPTWFVGYLGMKIDILGGLIRGNMRLKIKLGEECELVLPGGSPIGVPIINDIKPVAEETDVDVFAAPQVAFNMPMNKSFLMEDNNGEIKNYRFILDKFIVSEEGKEIPGKLEWNTSRNLVTFYSHDILPPQKLLKVNVEVGFEEYRNNRWEVVYTGGQKAREKMEIGFTTGTAPDNIPLQNIEYCYPVIDQRYYLSGEGTRGYVQLKRGQPYLFSADFKHEIHITDENGQSINTSFRYDAGINCLVYQMPGLSKASTYSLGIVTLPKKGTGGTADIREERLTIGGSGDDDVTIRSAKANAVTQTANGKIILEYAFGTSRYATLREKIAGINKRMHSFYAEAGYVYLEYILNDSEPFDAVDLVGTAYSGNKPLVKPWATLDDAFYKQWIYPLVYKNYPLAGSIRIRYRDTEKWGVPPAGAIPVNSVYLTLLESDPAHHRLREYFPYTYNLFRAYNRDYYDLRDQLVNRYIGKPELLKYADFINNNIPPFESGKYRVNFRFIQPDGQAGSSRLFEYEYTF